MIIPAAYIPNFQKSIDYDTEAAAFLTGKFYLPDGFALPSPPVGWYTTLELITSPFFLRPLECTAEDTFAALALLQAGRDGVFAADEFRKGRRGRLAELAERFADSHGPAVIQALDEVIQQTLIIPFQGLEMLPRGAENTKPFVFDSEFLGAVCASVAMTTGDPVDRVLWDMPLLRVGYIRVFRARYEGEKNVQRTSNQAATKKAIAEAREREERGELHPWQIAEPHRYLPNEKQIKANPEILKQHMELMQKARHK